MKNENSYKIYLRGDTINEISRFDSDISFVIKHLVSLFNQDTDSDFQLNFIKSSSSALFDTFEKTYPENWKEVKNKILQTIFEKIHPSQNIFYLELIDHLIDDKAAFNPLLTPAFQSYNPQERTSHNGGTENTENSQPVVMKLLNQYQAELDFVMDYLQFFNTTVVSKPEILFGKAKFSETNILFKPNKYSVNQWWEPIHFNLYNINEFHDISKEDFIEHNKQQYYDLYKKTAGIEVDGLLKVLLDSMLHSNLEKQYNDQAMGYAGDIKLSDEALTSVFINSLKEQATNKSDTNEVYEVTKVEEPSYDFTAIAEQAVIREIIMLEIFSRFKMADIEQVKDKLISLNLYPNHEELEQMLFIIMNPLFPGRNGNGDFIQANYQTIVDNDNLRKYIFSYINDFGDSNYATSELHFVLDKKLSLNEQEFDKWKSQYTHSFSHSSSYAKDSKDAINKFSKNIKTYISTVFQFAENSNYAIKAEDMSDNINDMTDHFIKNAEKDKMYISRTDIDMLQVQAMIDACIIKASLPKMDVEENIKKKRL